MLITYKIVLSLLIINLTSLNVYGLVSPVKRDQNNKPCLTNCHDIRLVSQVINLYHHPLGIWKITCICEFQNLYPKKIVQEMAFNSGYDIGINEGELYCDEFKNFKVAVEGEDLKNIKLKEQCPNYVERIGMEWTNDDRTGIGFLNTWQVEFKPEETKQIEISFSFVIKQPAIVFKSNLDESWYNELMAWTKHEYSRKPENDFVLPLNMGSFWTLFLDFLIIRTYFSDEWLIMEDQNSITYDPENIVKYTYSEAVGFFSPPAVELQNLTEDDLKDKTTFQLDLLRNSFFAKYGRKFKNKLLMLYFQQQPWYSENSDYDNWYLTDFDIENIKVIHQYTKQRKSND